MPRILLRETLTQKHMPQMRPTISTSNLRTHPIRIHTPSHSTRNLIIKTRPPTIRLKLTLRTIQRRPTTLTHISPLTPKRKILTRKRSLRTLTHNNTLLLPSQLLKTRLLTRQNKHQQTKHTQTKKPYHPKKHPTPIYSINKGAIEKNHTSVHSTQTPLSNMLEVC
jgi:hypothetical protein